MSKLIFNRPGLEVIITPRAVYVQSHTLAASDLAQRALESDDHVLWQDALRLSTLCKEHAR